MSLPRLPITMFSVSSVMALLFVVGCTAQTAITDGPPADQDSPVDDIPVDEPVVNDGDEVLRLQSGIYTGTIECQTVFSNGRVTDRTQAWTENWGASGLPQVSGTDIHVGRLLNPPSTFSSGVQIVVSVTTTENGAIIDTESTGKITSCSDTCRFSFDGECDDGGPGSTTAICQLGSDCTDCGPLTYDVEGTKRSTYRYVAEDQMEYTSASTATLLGTQLTDAQDCHGILSR